MNNQTERFGAERRALFRQAVEDLFKDSRMARVVHIGGISDDVYEIHFRNPVLTKIYLLGVKINTVPSDPDRRNVPEFRISYNMISDSLSTTDELHLLKRAVLVDLSTDEGIWEALEVLKRISDIVSTHIRLINNSVSGTSTQSESKFFVLPKPTEAESEENELKESLEALKDKLPVDVDGKVPFVDTDVQYSYPNNGVGGINLSELYPEKITIKEKGEMFSNYLTNLSDWYNTVVGIRELWLEGGENRQAIITKTHDEVRIELLHETDELKYSITLTNDSRVYANDSQKVLFNFEISGSKNEKRSHLLCISSGDPHVKSLHRRTAEWVYGVSHEIKLETPQYEDKGESDWRFIESSFNYLLFKRS